LIEPAAAFPTSVRGTFGGRITSMVTLAAASSAGLIAFFYPFLLSRAPSPDENNAHAGDAPLIFGVLAVMAAALFLVELSSGGMNAKVASALAVLAVAAAVMRLPPLPAGASGFYFLIILGGYVFGPRFGFLLGAVALFVSSFAAGGFGPWVPFQMFASGWLGLASGWLGGLRPHLARRPVAELAVLLAFGALAGFAYGALMNLWFWPYVSAGEGVSWRPGMGVLQTLRHYWAFYVLTSAGWDIWAAMGNVLLLAAAGRPVLSILTRFRDRFHVSWGDPPPATITR
jgi:energy-coupling factor transport system substrate-specific component